MSQQGSGAPGEERRRAPRFRASGTVLFQTDEGEGRGALHDISLTGARISDASLLPKPGIRLQMQFAPRADCLPVRLHATVVREVPNGFAVEFSFVDSRLKRLLQAMIDEAKGTDDAG